METNEQKINLLLDRGFIPQTKFQFGPKEDDKEEVPTGNYVLPGWEPEPVIEFTAYGFTGVIGRQTTRTTEVKALDKFLDKSVTTFCDKVRL